jgi:hypothetical protein
MKGKNVVEYPQLVQDACHLLFCFGVICFKSVLSHMTYQNMPVITWLAHLKVKAAVLEPDIKCVEHTDINKSLCSLHCGLFKFW